MINSIVCVALFIIVVGVLTNWETSAVNLAPGVCYYFIAKGILTDPLAKDEPDKKSERFSHAEDEAESKKSNIGSSSEIYDEELSLTNDMLQRKKL